MALIPPFFLDCVVAIGFSDSNSQRRWAGTGFLYGKVVKRGPSYKNWLVFLVTNKHVLKDQRVAHLRFNPKADEPAREYDLDLLDDQDRPVWFGHPDPEVDVAVVGIDANLLQQQGIQFAFFDGDEHVADRSKARELGFTEGDGVFILGFPMGIVGEERNFVIVRQGAIARIRDALAGKTKQFLVDGTVFPGNSGGPVVNRPEVISIEHTPAVSKALLLGIVASYVPYIDVAISAQTKRPRVTFEENSGLTHVFPMDYVKDVAEVAAATLLRRGQQTPTEVKPNPDAECSDHSPEAAGQSTDHEMPT